MFAAVMRPPVFGGTHEALPAMTAFASSPFRPSRPSPLASSSPIRASSPPASSLFPGPSQADTQSSPIQPSSSASMAFAAVVAPAGQEPSEASEPSEPLQPLAAADQPSSIFGFSAADTTTNKTPLFRFAARPAKPVPRGQQSRESAQQTRRQLFLRNVRQRGDDRNWERRNYEQEVGPASSPVSIRSAC